MHAYMQEMDICLEIMVISPLLLFIIAGLGEGQNMCAESRCGGDGPAIHFPFRVNSQPDDCGYPGFNLSCTDTNQTVLQLPTSVKLFVKSIDYKSQEIQLMDPHQCFPWQLRGLDLSSSAPFQLSEYYFNISLHYDISDYALFNCSGEMDEYRISCLSNLTYQVYAVDSHRNIANVPISCIKMYNLRSIPDPIILNNDDKILRLRWSTRKDKGALSKLWIIGVILGSLLLILLAIFALYHFYTYDKVEKEHQARIEKFLEDYRNCKPTRYSYADIKRITNQFTEKLGEGAYGIVFKGKLSNEIYVAVKILNTSKGNGEEFINEVGTIGRIHHVNVVRLVGFCADGFRRALIYEFLPNDSLEKLTSSTTIKNCILNWDKLEDIALGVAKGIEYLHQGCDQRILHFDIKPCNVLLDQNFNPKISDFGLAKLCSKDQSAVSMTTVRGTLGYIAPEVFSRNFGNVSYKADVYSFGILLLEIVGGRKNVGVVGESTGQVYFPEWIYNLLEQKEDIRIFVEDDGNAKIAKKLSIVGLWCIQWHPTDRPSMKNVVQMLEGEGNILTMPPNPFASTGPIKINANMPTKHLNHELEIIPELE